MSARKSLSYRLLPKALIAGACFVALSAAAQQPPAAAAAQPQPSMTAPRAAASAPPLAAAPEPVSLPTSPISAATAAEIQKINEQMTLLQAKLNELELRAKIAAKQKEINGTAPDAASAQSSFDRKNGIPSVVSVAGLRGNLEALLVFPGGVTQRVKAGDVIDDRRVAKVAINEVVLTDLKGQHVQRLAFGASPMTRENTPMQTAAGGPPPLLPIPLPSAMPQSMQR